MSSPPELVQPIPEPAGRKPIPQPGVPLGTSPSIPNIPPRSHTGSASLVSKSFSRSFKSPPPLSGSSSSRRGPTPKASIGEFKKDSAGLNTSGSGPSGISAQLGKSPVQSSRRGSIAQPDKTQSGTITPRDGESNFSNVVDVNATNEEKARILRRHLVSAEERAQNGKESPGVNSPGNSGFNFTEEEPENADESGVASRSGSIGHDENFPIPYDAPGGDVTHDIYKWQHDHRPRPGRSASFSHIPRDQTLEPSLAHIKEPGGFRRNFIVNRAQEQGVEPPTVVRNVIDFLFLYGHFAGEDLDEDDDDDEDEEEDEQYLTPEAAERGYATQSSERDGSGRPLTRGQSSLGERAPLLGNRSMSKMSKTRHRRNRSGPAQGTASVTQAVLMLLKGFVGTGILFMGKAFFNGGLVFSAVVMVGIAAISLYSFLLLTKTYLVVPGSFGDIGGALYGKWMRLTILTSITVSQIGFVAAYTIFIAENLQAFVLAVTNCKTFIPTRYLIFAQLVIFLPLAMIRNLAKLSGTALVADAFILIGLVYIVVNETTVLSKHGLADVQWFNPDSFPLLIGTAVFAFEGIGLVIPITESMKEPRKFPAVLSGVMLIVAILFAGSGVLGYAAYGSDIQTVVIVNLPQDDKFVQAVQFLYSIAILLSIPLQLFPAVRIMENGLFSRSGKHNPSVKWQKNLFRAGTVLCCTLISWAGSSELDKFVSLIGAFACIPLCFIYPPLLHLKACAKTRTAKAIDYALLTFGILVGIYTTVQTVKSLFAPGGGGTQFGKCQPPKGS